MYPSGKLNAHSFWTGFETVLEVTPRSRRNKNRFVSLKIFRLWFDAINKIRSFQFYIISYSESYRIRNPPPPKKTEPDRQRKYCKKQNFVVSCFIIQSYALHGRLCLPYLLNSMKLKSDLDPLQNCKSDQESTIQSVLRIRTDFDRIRIRIRSKLDPDSSK
jgi:hypothetical protein